MGLMFSGATISLGQLHAGFPALFAAVFKLIAVSAVQLCDGSIALFAVLYAAVFQLIAESAVQLCADYIAVFAAQRRRAMWLFAYCLQSKGCHIFVHN
eukprot:scaffold100767_cov18-Tisochrysis_lutea.AAC.1